MVKAFAAPREVSHGLPGRGDGIRRLTSPCHLVTLSSFGGGVELVHHPRVLVMEEPAPVQQRGSGVALSGPRNKSAFSPRQERTLLTGLPDAPEARSPAFRPAFARSAPNRREEGHASLPDMDGSRRTHDPRFI